MLLPQTSSHCQSQQPLKRKNVLAAFHLWRGQLLLRSLPACSKRVLEGIKWREDDQDLHWRRSSDWGASRQLRSVNAVLLKDSGMAYSDSKEVPVNLAALLTTSFNQASFNLIRASKAGPSRGRPDLDDAEKKKQESEMQRRKRISEANKGRIPWNKWRQGDHNTLEKGSSSQSKVVEPISEEEKERLRREKISRANSGKIPWNKGGKHSQQTKLRIREGVIERMKDPKIRERLRLQAEAVKLSPEIRLKISAGIIRAWNRKRQFKAKQEQCVLEWQEMIACTARVGDEGDVVYQWDSYDTLKEQLRLAWQPPLIKRRKGVRRASCSLEHRTRISAAIKAKWDDPNYRINVQTGLRQFLLNQISSPKRREATDSHKAKHQVPNKLLANRDRARERINSKSSLKADFLEPVVEKPSVELPHFQDPESQKKLKKLISLRVHRNHAEAQKQSEIIERARALILQAGEAAKALEATAVKDKNALAPLLETRRLLAEAVNSLESMNRKKLNPEVIEEAGSSLFEHVLSLAHRENPPPPEQGSRNAGQCNGVKKSSLQTYQELNER